VRYGTGRLYNGGSHTINSQRDMPSVRLYIDQQHILLDLPTPAEAVVPHLGVWQPPA